MVAKVWAAVGDITEQDVDAVVNAANRWLASGAGVCGAIFAAAGYEEMRKHCSNLLRAEGIEAVPVGQSVVTPGGKLKAKWVIHTVGPEYGQNHGRDAELLASCYLTILTAAEEKGMKSVAIPAISTGIFGYPPVEAAKVASSTILKEIGTLKTVQEVRLVFFQAADLEVFKSNSVLAV